MRKLKLAVEALQVESFHAVEPHARRGTVVGHSEFSFDGSCKYWCSQDTGCATCEASCNGTCHNTCAGSCPGTCDVTCAASCPCTDYSGCGCETWETCPGATICA